MFIRRSWVNVDPSVVLENIRCYQKALGHEAEIMAVVKADAYGHGDRQVARFLWENGVRLFAVSNIEEAAGLREEGIGGRILILGYTPVREAARLLYLDLDQALLDEEYTRMLAASNLPVRCQMALDTGMNRIGLDADDPAACEALIRQTAAGPLKLTGLFTHLCCADGSSAEDHAFTLGQIRKFEAAADRTADLHLEYVHCMNTAGGLRYRSKYDSVIRLGIMMYGLKPDISLSLPEGIRPALEWRSVVSMIKTVHRGESIGYGRTFTANRDIRAATIPTGYADGYSRLLSGRGYVLINGKRAPLLGRVCMDQMVADITQIADVNIGTEVVLIGSSGSERLTADDLASQIGTIGYEVVSGISKRVQRNYTSFANENAP